MAIRLALHDETVTTFASVVDNIVTGTFSIKQNKNAPKYVISGMEFDFTGVSQDEILVAAFEHFKVRFSSVWRKTEPAKRDDLIEAGCQVRALIDIERKPVDKKASARKTVSELSDDEFDAFIAEQRKLRGSDDHDPEEII